MVFCNFCRMFTIIMRYIFLKFRMFSLLYLRYFLFILDTDMLWLIWERNTA